MGYTRIGWPYSQKLMELTDEEMEELGIELGDDCSFFVPDEAREPLKEKGYRLIELG